MKYDFTQKRLMQARNYIIKFLFCSSISFSDACIKVNIIWIFRWTIKAYLFGFTLAPMALWLALGRLLQNLPDQFDLTPLLVSVRHQYRSTLSPTPQRNDPQRHGVRILEFNKYKFIKPNHLLYLDLSDNCPV